MNTLTILNRAVANRMTDEQRKAVFAKLKGGMAEDEAKLKQYGVWGGTAAPAAAATGAVVPLLKAIPSTKGMIRQQLSGTLTALRQQTRGAASGAALQRLGQELEVAKRYRRLPDVTHQEVQQFDRTIQRAYDLLRKATSRSQQQASAFAESRRLNDALRTDIQRIRAKESVRLVKPLGNRLPPTNDPNERRRRAYWARMRGSGGSRTTIYNPIGEPSTGPSRPTPAPAPAPRNQAPQVPASQRPAAPDPTARVPLGATQPAPAMRSSSFRVVSQLPGTQMSGFQQWILNPGPHEFITPPLAGDEYYNAKVIALYDQYRRSHPNDANPPPQWLAVHPEWRPPATPERPIQIRTGPSGQPLFAFGTSAGTWDSTGKTYVFDENPYRRFEGPMVALYSRLSAAAAGLRSPVTAG